MTCARTGKVAAAKALIEAGASIDAVESWRGQTALMWAAADGHADMVRALVAAGADITAVGNGAGRTLVAMAQGNPEMQEALRRHGAR